MDNPIEFDINLNDQVISKETMKILRNICGLEYSCERIIPKIIRSYEKQESIEAPPKIEPTSFEEEEVNYD